MSTPQWREIAPRVYVRRYQELELNCGLVLGDRRALVIDTQSSSKRGEDLAASIKEVTSLEPVVVNTHAHYDHCFGNSAFRDSQIYSHSGAAADLLASAEHQMDQLVTHLNSTDRPDWAQEVTNTEVVVPFYLIDEDTELDLGNRSVHLLYGGKAHTDHDLVVAVPDVGVVFWGDMVEQGADPMMDDAYPLEWAKTMRALQERAQVQDAAICVPGHGDVVDQDFVSAQADKLQMLADALGEGLESRVRDVDALVSESRGIGLQDETLRGAAVRVLEISRQD